MDFEFKHHIGARQSMFARVGGRNYVFLGCLMDFFLVFGELLGVCFCVWLVLMRFLRNFHGFCMVLVVLRAIVRNPSYPELIISWCILVVMR